MAVGPEAHGRLVRAAEGGAKPYEMPPSLSFTASWEKRLKERRQLFAEVLLLLRRRSSSAPGSAAAYEVQRG